MAGKSLDEIWRQMQSQRQAEIGRQQAQERANNIEQYSDRTLVEITDGEETELILIHKNGVETLSINQKYLSYESNDSYDND